MSRRIDQVGSTLARALQERLARGLSDPRVRGLVTVTGVEVSEDLSVARVKVTVMPAEHEALTLHGLRSAAGRLRREIGPRLHLRTMPALEFEVDQGLKEQAAVMALLARDRAERAERGDSAGWGPPGHGDASRPGSGEGP